MQAFEYKTEFSPNDANLLDEVGGPILRAAHRVMVYAHTNPKTGKLVSRGKIDPEIPYITHTMMVYQLLCAMGEDDPVVLAAALLHDALEDCKEFGRDPAKMQAMLQHELQAEGVNKKEAATISREIMTICKQVKNSKVRNEHKLNAQLKEVPFMGHEAKIIKIADQTASLIDHLRMPNDLLAVPQHKSVAFANKAHNLVGKIVHFKTAFEDGQTRRVTLTEQRQLLQWDALFVNVEQLNRRLLRAHTAHEQEDARGRFEKRSPYLVRNALRHRQSMRKAVEDDLRDGDVSYTFEFPKQAPISSEAIDGIMPLDECGISRLALNSRGEVVRFTVWVAPEEHDKHPRNLTARMVSEMVATHRQVNMDDTQLHSVLMDNGRRIDEGRRFILDLPMEARAFFGIAIHAGAMSEEQAQHVLKNMRTTWVESLGIAKQSASYKDVALNHLRGGGDTPGR